MKRLLLTAFLTLALVAQAAAQAPASDSRALKCRNAFVFYLDVSASMFWKDTISTGSTRIQEMTRAMERVLMGGENSLIRPGDTVEVRLFDETVRPHGLKAFKYDREAFRGTLGAFLSGVNEHHAKLADIERRERRQAQRQPAQRSRGAAGPVAPPFEKGTDLLAVLSDMADTYESIRASDPTVGRVNFFLLTDGYQSRRHIASPRTETLLGKASNVLGKPIRDGSSTVAVLQLSGIAPDERSEVEFLARIQDALPMDKALNDLRSFTVNREMRERMMGQLSGPLSVTRTSLSSALTETSDGHRRVQVKVELANPFCDPNQLAKLTLKVTYWKTEDRRTLSPAELKDAKPLAEPTVEVELPDPLPRFASEETQSFSAEIPVERSCTVEVTAEAVDAQGRAVKGQTVSRDYEIKDPMDTVMVLVLVAFAAFAAWVFRGSFPYWKKMKTRRGSDGGQ